MTTSAAVHSSTDVAELQALLAERDALVRELTERLGGAAEKLDRLHRQGLDRGQRVSGFPREVIEQQTELVNEMQHSVQRWEDMQSAACFGRLEWQLGELRDYVEQKFAEAEARQQSANDESGAEGPTTDDDMAEQTSAAGELVENSGIATNEETPESTGDAADNQFCPQTLLETASVTLMTNATGAMHPDGTESQEPGEWSGTACSLDSAEPPQSINLLDATTLDLQAHLDEQDQFIAMLARSLEEAARESGTIEWNDFDGSDADWIQRLQQAEYSLSEMLRLADYEARLQRQRLQRKEALLRVKERQLQKRAAAIQ